VVGVEGGGKSIEPDTGEQKVNGKGGNYKEEEAGVSESRPLSFDFMLADHRTGDVNALTGRRRVAGNLLSRSKRGGGRGKKSGGKRVRI